MRDECRKESKFVCMPSHSYDAIAHSNKDVMYSLKPGADLNMSRKARKFDFNFLDKDVIALNITESGENHYSQAFIINPGLACLTRFKAKISSIADTESIPVIVHADSLPGCTGHPKTEDVGKALRRWLNALEKERDGGSGRTFTKISLPIVSLKSKYYCMESNCCILEFRLTNSLSFQFQDSPTDGPVVTNVNLCWLVSLQSIEGAVVWASLIPTRMMTSRRLEQKCATIQVI
jgi:hypothetical protein